MEVLEVELPPPPPPTPEEVLMVEPPPDAAEVDCSTVAFAELPERADVVLEVLNWLAAVCPDETFEFDAVALPTPDVELAVNCVAPELALDALPAPEEEPAVLLEAVEAADDAWM